MTKKLTLLLTVLIVLFGFIGCPDNGNNNGNGNNNVNNDIEVTLNSVTANGSETETTTQLTLTFNEAIEGFSINDITLSGITGVTKGTLSNSGATYTLPISGFTESGTLNVTILKTGFNINGTPKTVGVFYDPILKSVEMQVYNSDKTTPYTGEDLDFYIQGDTSKTLAATIRSGKLVIRYIDLPAGLNTITWSGTNDGLERLLLVLVSDNSKKLSYLGTSMGQIAVYYYNKDGSWVISNTTINVTKGWNFYVYPISSTDPADDREGKFRWVIESNP